jgi:hypothetical protein
VVTFCQTDADMAVAAAQYLLGSFRHGGSGIAVVTSARVRQIDQWIADAGTNPAALRANGSYLVLDAGTAMDQFLARGWPDPAAFWRTISPVVERAAAGGHRPVRVFGELLSLLWQAGQFGAAIEVEALWNELARQHRMSLLCGHLGTRAIDPDPDDELALVLAAHSRVAAVPWRASTRPGLLSRPRN